MAIDLEKISPTLKRELEHLTTTRDELKLQMHLAKSEAHSEWERLEGQWSRVEQEFKHALSETKTPIQEIGVAARGLMDEVKQGYERIRKQLKTH